MADQNKVLICLVYGADHSLSKDSQEYELAEEIRRDERDACAKVCETSDRYRGDYFAAVIRARGTT
jgi:hypothetical protein